MSEIIFNLAFFDNLFSLIFLVVPIFFIFPFLYN